ncbi:MULTISPECIES: sensor histidine kinase [unclassified Pseudomonas]|uniref:PAS domain-containing sensor histidine kinase n=1 Tax=unclassified Pseudomonas TaxID=196821 RepID=UPI00244D5708|nr:MULTISPECIES: sensor histidine kinase [unclassified Pseudomonas]MDG9926100.1 transporter substrate-binding domain-containing protein [Pseudomonas sp. GD04045]MDH0034156.1 transporter substrate-binding domain-containing protein [Pseudomonas sp. GD04019]
MIRLLCWLLLLFPLLGQAAELDAAQRAWLAEHPRLRAGVVLQAPYAEYQRRQQQLSGLNIELGEALAKTLGIELSWLGYADQAALDQALRAGRVDFAPGLTQTPAGLRLWQFSDPYLRVPHLLVGERLGELGVELENLGEREPLAVREPSAVADYLRGNYFNLRLQAQPSDREALRAVLAQRARYAVIDQAQLSRLSQESEFAGLTVVADVGLPQLLRFGTRRDWPELATILDAGLRQLPAEQLEQLQQRWLTARTPSLGESALFWRNLSVLLGLLLLVSLALLAVLRRQRGGLEKRLLEARATLARREVAEEALRLAQFSLDHSTVGILWVNWDSRVRYANQAVAEMLGYDSRAMVDRPLQDFEPNLGMDRWLGLWKRVRQHEEGALSFESNCRRADGSWMPADVTLGFLRFRDAEYLVVYLTDVTERRRAHAALEESEARLKGIAGNVPGLVFRLERPLPGAPVDFAFISEGSEQLVGYPPTTIMAADFGIRSLVHPEDRAAYHATQDAAIEAASDWQWQGRILTCAGRVRWADIKASARQLSAEHVVWDGVVWDISDNKTIELELAESRAQLRELSAHLESVREEEKARIAREVHDELGQVLTVLKLETSMCELAYAGLDPGLQARLDSMKKLIANLFQLVRDVATALRPPILDAGIASAIEWQARRFEARSGIACLVQVPEQLPALTDAKAIGLFRVLQEALTNVLRHAQAHSVEITLEVQDGELCLSVSDDGRGFEPAAQRAQSFGLVGMRERVLMLGGRLVLDSTPGEGTTLVVHVALDSEVVA